MKEKNCDINVIIPVNINNKEKLALILEAERNLRKAGVSFDKSFDFNGNFREWQLDWSLKGAKVKCLKDKKERD